MKKKLIVCASLVCLLSVSSVFGHAPITAPGFQDTVKIPPDQLDSLVAPIALYPDPLLS